MSLAHRVDFVKIANGQTVSGPFYAGGMGRFALVIPAAFTGTTISFQVSHDGVAYQPLYGSDNVAVSMTVAPGRSYVLPATLGGWLFFKVVSGSAEAAERTLYLMALSDLGGGGTGGGSGAAAGGPVTSLAGTAGSVDSLAASPNLVFDSGGTARPVAVSQFLYNEATYDRWRNNAERVLLASTPRTADTNSPDQTNHNWRGGHFLIDVTALTTNVIPTIEGKIGSTYYPLLVGPTITTIGVTILKVYPGIAPIAGGAASDVLPRVFRVSLNHLDATTMTYSVMFAGVV